MRKDVTLTNDIIKTCKAVRTDSAYVSPHEQHKYRRKTPWKPPLLSLMTHSARLE